MKCSVLLVSTLAVLAKAAVTLTNSNYDVSEGVPFTLTWTGSTDPVTIKLKSGASNDLKDVETITASGTGGSFTWTPDNIPSGTYAFEITDSAGTVNYSQQFSYQGTGTLSATTSTASSTASTASTASTTKSSSTSSETESTTSSARLTSSTMTPLTNSTTMSTSTHASTSRSSSTATTTSSSSTSTSTGVPNTNNGQRLASSLALVLGAVAAFVAFN